MTPTLGYLSNRSKASACLLHTDPRSRYQVRLPPKLPGMHYSVDEQCQILFGTNATFCNDMEVQYSCILNVTFIYLFFFQKCLNFCV